MEGLNFSLIYKIIVGDGKKSGSKKIILIFQFFSLKYFFRPQAGFNSPGATRKPMPVPNFNFWFTENWKFQFFKFYKLKFQSVYYIHHWYRSARFNRSVYNSEHARFIWNQYSASSMEGVCLKCGRTFWDIDAHNNVFHPLSFKTNPFLNQS